MSDPELRAAELLLQEAVYEARARQAAGAGLSPHSLNDPAPEGGCGLGSGRSLENELELSERGLEIARALWPVPLAPVAARRVRDVLQEWVERQDALDRKRNHFLRDFRQEHGFDRRAYPPEVARAFERGLERINAEVRDRLQRTARQLLDAATFPSSAETAAGGPRD